MLDITLRPLKDGLFTPLSRSIPQRVTPLHITLAAFLCGLVSCVLAWRDNVNGSILFWTLNRSLDCLDGAVARHRNQQSDLGGFLDLLCDFITYALIPIAVAGRNASLQATRDAEMLLVALLEAAFWINNFVLFYIAAHLEKKDAKGKTELTSMAMRPALVEGFESGVFFTLMLAMPERLGLIAAVMATGVAIGTGQRVKWFVDALR